MIIPLCTHGEPVGFIYGDWDDRFPSVYLSQTEFGLLKAAGHGTALPELCPFSGQTLAMISTQ